MTSFNLQRCYIRILLDNDKLRVRVGCLSAGSDSILVILIPEVHSVTRKMLCRPRVIFVLRPARFEFRVRASIYSR
jgi:hypothetical protein